MTMHYPNCETPTVHECAMMNMKQIRPVVVVSVLTFAAGLAVWGSDGDEQPKRLRTHLAELEKRVADLESTVADVREDKERLLGNCVVLLQNAMDQADLVRTRRLEILDAEGRVRIVLGSKSDTGEHLLMFDSKANTRVALMTKKNADGPTLSLIGANASINLAVAPPPPTINVLNATGLSMFAAGFVDGAGLVLVRDSSTNRTVGLSTATPSGIEKGIATDTQ